MKRTPFILLTLLFHFIHLQGEIHSVPDEFSLIQTAIDSSDWGDTVLVTPGTYNELLQIPIIELTLTSDYMFSQDTSDINETILDGEYQGTIVEVLPTSNDRIFRLNGFTVKRGLGWYGEFPWLYGGGAVQAFDSVNLVLENCVFTENIAPRDGAVLSMGSEGNNGNVLLRNLKIFNNNHLDSLYHQKYAIYGFIFGDLTIDGLHAFGVGEEKYLMSSGAYDTLLVKNLTVENFNNYYSKIVRLTTCNYMHLENIHFRNNSVPSYLLDLGGAVNQTTITIRNLWLTDNSPSRGIRINTDTLYADSLFFLRNQNGNSYVCGLISVDAVGEIHNLTVQDNVGGAFGYQPEGFPPIILSTWCSIYDGLFENNTIMLHNDPDDPDDFVSGGEVLYYAGLNPPNVLDNCRFINNYHDDPDDYSNPNVDPSGNQGRCLDISLGDDKGTILRHCLFQNNRQPNIAPDKPWELAGSGGVGSVIRVDGPGFSGYTSSLELDDVVILENDDGGIKVAWVSDVSMRNVQVVDTPRRGIWVVASENTLLENIYISGVTEQENYHQYPYTWCMHTALTCIGSESAVVRNATIINCDLPYILGGGNASSAQTVFENSIFWGNSYDIWQRPSDYPQPIGFTYSLIQEELAGEGNIWDTDPMFHSELGPPYLDPASPCIDAGNPDPVYNDPEDPDNSGWPLWPSQGTLRNDIGFTGGPYAMVQEFEAIPNAGAAPRGCPPQTIQLSQNYPNPFNPTTTIEFTLPYPQEVQLAVYNILGQQVQLLTDCAYSAGVHQVRFDGSGLSSGLYMYQLSTDHQVLSRKMLLIE